MCVSFLSVTRDVHRQEESSGLSGAESKTIRGPGCKLHTAQAPSPPRRALSFCLCSRNESAAGETFNCPIYQLPCTRSHRQGSRPLCNGATDSRMNITALLLAEMELAALPAEDMQATSLLHRGPLQAPSCSAFSLFIQQKRSSSRPGRFAVLPSVRLGMQGKKQRENTGSALALCCRPQETPQS